MFDDDDDEITTNLITQNMILFNLNEKEKLRKIDDIHFVEFNMKIGAEKKRKQKVFIYLYLKKNVIHIRCT